MSIDINYYLGAFNESYEGGFGGVWANKVATIKRGLTALTDQMPGLEAPPSMQPFTGTRQKKMTTDNQVTVHNTPYESSTEYPLDNYNLDPLGIFENNV